MPYCNWCHLDSDTDDFCIWCKRPFTSGPSLFNLQKKNDIHFLATDDDSSDLPIPIFAIVGVIVFVAIVGFAWFAFRKNEALAQNPPSQVTDVGDLKPANQPRPLTDQQQWQASRTGSNFAPSDTPVPSPAPAPMFNRGTVAQTTTNAPAYNHTQGIIVNGIMHIIPVALSYVNTNTSIDPARPIYFESAKFQIEEDSKGVSHLTGEVVIVNNGSTSLASGRFWLKIGGTKLLLHQYSGKIENPRDLGLIDLPAKSYLDCYVFAEGYNKSINIKLKKSVGMDAEVAGAPLNLDGGEISAPAS